MWSILFFTFIPLTFAIPQLPFGSLPLSSLPVSALSLSTLPISTPLNVPASDLIPGRYIVKAKALDQLVAALKVLKTNPLFVYNFGNFFGFAADISPTAMSLLRVLPGLESIEQDARVRTLEIDTHLEKRAYVTQSPSTWGLHRLSHKVNSSTPNYVYDSSAGTGTCAYVIDTGIYTAHPEFEGRAIFLANFAGDGLNADGNGHGTHCAGTIASKTYGVAKKAKVFAVKVLGVDGSGSNSAVIAGLNFIVNDLKAGRATSCPNGAVASMSLGGSKSTSVNAAAASAVAQGIFMAAAAGNEAKDANATSPASEPSMFTVAAMDINNRFATSFSNFGTGVDGLAPGVSIQSTWLAGQVNTLSGTSMATPHVAGLALYLLALEGKRTPANLTDRIKALALKNVITQVPSTTVNSLVFNGNPSG